MKPSIIFFILCVAVFACSYYRDEFAISPPEEGTTTVLVPGLVQFSFRQQQAPSNKISSKGVTNSVKARKLIATDKISFLVSAYSQTPPVNDNLLYRSTFDLIADSTTFNLGNTYALPLTPSNLDFKVLDGGNKNPQQVSFRGTYIGTFKLTKGGSQVSVGTISGYIDYKGNFAFEFKSVDDTLILSGTGITGTTAADVLISAKLSDRDGRTITPSQATLNFTSPALSGTIPLLTSSYDALTINLSPQ